MKKFCSGDIVPGWPPLSDAAQQTTLQGVFASCLFQNSVIPSVSSMREDERRSSLQEANAA